MTKWILPAVLVGLMGAALGASAAPPPPLIVGIVDMEQVQARFEAYQEANRAFRQFRNAELRALQQLEAGWALGNSERERCLRLLNIVARTDAQTEELESLLRTHQEREQRYLALQRTEDRTPEETQELRALDDLFRRRQEAFQETQREVNERIEQHQRELVEPLDRRIQDVARVLAEENGLAVILVREVVVYGGVDITEEFVIRLNAEPEDTE